MSGNSATRDQPLASFDTVIVGAGAAGLYLLYRLRDLGQRVRVFEAGAGVGGTWYWNRYPGARCDNESLHYSYSFSEELQQEWSWSERFAGQPEILRYLNHVADRFDLRRDIQLDTRVTAARFDEDANRWLIETDRGDRVAARFFIMATGCLSMAQAPRFAGLDSYAGRTYHTGHWPHAEVDFTGQRVGIIGTGSSAIQSIPHIAAQAAHLYVFQRTANYSIPSRNGPMDPDYERAMKERYVEYRQQARLSRGGFIVPFNDQSALAVDDAERQREYEARWAAGGVGFLAAYSDLRTDIAANTTAADFVRAKIRQIVHDPAVAELLAPADHPIGTKRICVDTNYYETFNRPNVTLVDVRRAPIEALTPRGLRTCEADYELDSIVFATGFDAMTGALLAVDIRGRADVSLREKWSGGPRTYLGLSVAGFPNLFTITGPGSPSVLSNMMVSIEQHVEWIATCIAYLDRHGYATIEANSADEDAWVTHVNEVAQTTLYPRANSWYMGANIPGKPRLFMPYVGGVGVYRQHCDRVAAGGYTGFNLRSGVLAQTS